MSEVATETVLRNADKLRARLRHQFGEALGNDPVCGGRVSSATVDWLADEALRACEAVAHNTRERMTPLQASDPASAVEGVVEAFRREVSDAIEREADDPSISTVFRMGMNHAAGIARTCPISARKE